MCLFRENTLIVRVYMYMYVWRWASNIGWLWDKDSSKEWWQKSIQYVAKESLIQKLMTNNIHILYWILIASNKFHPLNDRSETHQHTLSIKIWSCSRSSMGACCQYCRCWHNDTTTIIVTRVYSWLRIYVHVYNIHANKIQDLITLSAYARGNWLCHCRCGHKNRQIWRCTCRHLSEL